MLCGFCRVPNSYAVGPQARQVVTERKDGWASMPKLSRVLSYVAGLSWLT